MNVSLKSKHLKKFKLLNICKYSFQNCSYHLKTIQPNTHSQQLTGPWQNPEQNKKNFSFPNLDRNYWSVADWISRLCRFSWTSTTLLLLFYEVDFISTPLFHGRQRLFYNPNRKGKWNHLILRRTLAEYSEVWWEENSSGNFHKHFMLLLKYKKISLNCSLIENILNALLLCN